MVYLEGICMVEADTHVVWDQFNAEGPVFISMLRGQPKTPPSGDDLAVLDYHLNTFLSHKCPLVRG